MADEINGDEEKSDEEKSDKEKKESSGGEDFGALTGEGSASDSGLGNLPPLSDFDSVDQASDANLPPLDDLSSGLGSDTSSSGGLPPLSEMKLATPGPDTSGSDIPESPTFDEASGIEPPASGFDTPSADLDTPAPALDTPPSDGLDTPVRGGAKAGDGLGFQDLAADSDFSPETPELGPGPDSDIETPMFDSAFGGDSGEFATTGSGDTPSPTKAIETPMFDTPGADEGPDTGGGLGFDQDAFGATPMGVDVGESGGTPIPDFSPDTGQAQDISLESPAPAARKKKKGARGILATALFSFIAAAAGAGILWGLYYGEVLTHVTARNLIIEKEAEIAALKGEVRSGLERATGAGPGEMSSKDLEELIERVEAKSIEESNLNDEIANLVREMQVKQIDFTVVQDDLEGVSIQYVQAQEMVEALQNEIAITEARHEGLQAENLRLTEMVGTLEEADLRRQATKDTLAHNLELLLINLRDSLDLLPARYAKGIRVERAGNLLAKVSATKWVDPELLDEYTALYLEELEIARTHEYFFARIPVHDELGVVYMKWAECLMNGNWSVFYRTIDGKHIGSYESDPSTNGFAFKEDLAQSVQDQIQERIEASRVEDFEDKLAVLAEKQSVFEAETPLQRAFGSL